MNNVILSGRLSTDVTLRYTKGGASVANFDIAVRKSFSKNEEDAYPVDFHHIVVWNKLADTCSNNLIKGRRVLVRGALANETYTDSEGNKKRKTFINASVVEFLDSRRTEKDSVKGDSAAEGGEEVTNSEIDPAILAQMKSLADEEVPF
ncbi:single-stranded DNA-binding protein [uncultured Mitsuokella sp.]|uniref:single-stranded DNA-binding protein n=1 Tax=uncultured Mitsuokella sp. TaxID=453120 RepID=UPI0026060033|nr:single-stranded DNA-binding protein [uncultured Mitsuokella sp.]